MKRKLLHLLEKIFKRVILVFPMQILTEHASSAVRSKQGFWYVGNVFNTSDISYGIAYNDGIVEKDETLLVEEILSNLVGEKEFVFYDIGANTGYYGILAAFTGKNTISHSFEPIKEHLDCLNASIYLNRLEQKIKVHPFALGREEGMGKIFLAGSGTTFHSDFLNHVPDTRTVQIRRLDDMQIPPPDFIKIDVEGYEYDVLCGANKTLSENAPVLFVEIAYTIKSRNYKNSNYDVTLELLKNLNYEAYVLDKTLKKIKKTVPDGVRMYLFLHKVKHATLIEKFNKKIKHI